MGGFDFASRCLRMSFLFSCEDGIETSLDTFSNCTPRQQSELKGGKPEQASEAPRAMEDVQLNLFEE